MATTTTAQAGVLNRLPQRAVPLRAQQRRAEVPRAIEGALRGPQMLPPDPIGATAQTGGAQPVSSLSGLVHVEWIWALHKVSSSTCV